MKKLLLLSVVFIASVVCAQTKDQVTIIGYYAGDAKRIDDYDVTKLTHIIYSFCHLKGNKLNVDNKGDSQTIQHLVALKKKKPGLKVILSLGGWSGCEPCSQVFSTAAGRNEFARSVKHLNEYFKTDGIDLDWEYPAIEGYPGHRFVPEDKHNFTLLLQELRQVLGDQYEVSFAAGGFTKFLQQSIEWDKIVPYVDKVNLMTYDLVHGYSKVTGHHTPLYSTPEQTESTDNAIRYLDSIGFPKNKLVIGAAFYARIFDADVDASNGLYQPGKFDRGFSWNQFDMEALKKEGYVYYWDDVAKAPYMYNAAKKKIITFDNEQSIALKTKYAIDKKLNGIMFWQLADDKPTGGLLDVMYKAAHE
ncbi:glycoside hydrolase family 18 protein [Panacibacter sp. DH6]|uniref:chitinase n=1 Tax=Panacibacter microcysteis TaxID=2793269 RepID=A0A931E7E5_9BACT|nr:glycoside hydrolase family 18 protein [Panacibacter microcysteis]MBG9376463.1 glycoside hydrolase family 18 protein [Panacibacter microcysteis]